MVSTSMTDIHRYNTTARLCRIHAKVFRNNPSFCVTVCCMVRMLCYSHPFLYHSPFLSLSPLSLYPFPSPLVPHLSLSLSLSSHPPSVLGGTRGHRCTTRSHSPPSLPILGLQPSSLLSLEERWRLTFSR